MKFRKNVLRACFIGIALMMQGAHAAAPNTIIGCVTNPNGHLCGFNFPSAIAITPIGITPAKAYVCNFSGNTVSVIDVDTDTIIDCVTNPDGYPCAILDPIAIAITPNGATAYVVNNGNNTVSVIDVATNTLIGCVEVPYAYDATCGLHGPVAIAITPNGSKAYVCNQGNNTVSVIDIATNTIIACVENPYGYLCGFSDPFAIAITPDGAKVYVVNMTGNTVTVIDVATDAIIDCVENPNGYSCGFNVPIGIAITPIGIIPAKAYVCNFSAHTVSVIDVATDTIIDCVTNPYGYSCGIIAPKAIAITPDGTTAYVGNQASGTVNIIDVATDTIIGCVENPDGLSCGFNFPERIAITPSGSKAYVTNSNGNSVSVLGNIPVPPPPITILPPASVSGCKTQNIFLLQTDFINNITWTAPTSGSTPVGYKIYRDPALTQLVATVPANGPLQYYDHDRQPNVIYSYYIVSVDANGNVSTANSVTVTNPC